MRTAAFWNVSPNLLISMYERSCTSCQKNMCSIRSHAIDYSTMVCIVKAPLISVNHCRLSRPCANMCLLIALLAKVVRGCGGCGMGRVAVQKLFGRPELDIHTFLNKGHSCHGECTLNVWISLSLHTCQDQFLQP